MNDTVEEITILVGNALVTFADRPPISGEVGFLIGKGAPLDEALTKSGPDWSQGENMSPAPRFIGRRRMVAMYVLEEPETDEDERAERAKERT